MCQKGDGSNGKNGTAKVLNHRGYTVPKPCHNSAQIWGATYATCQKVTTTEIDHMPGMSTCSITHTPCLSRKRAHGIDCVYSFR